jgi:hypothetical protein
MRSAYFKLEFIVMVFKALFVIYSVILTWLEDFSREVSRIGLKSSQKKLVAEDANIILERFSCLRNSTNKP